MSAVTGRWAGPALLGAGLLVVAALYAAPAAADPDLRWWVLARLLSAERIVPLVGLGIALALAADARSRLIAATLLAAGVAVGFGLQDALLGLLERLPCARAGTYLTGPIATLSVGLALAAGPLAARLMLPVAAAVVGAMQGLAIVLTDPTRHDPAVPVAGILATAWITGSVALTVAAFQRSWFVVGGRIVGSWLIAIGLMYGAASMVPPRIVLPPWPRSDSQGPAVPGREDLFPDETQRRDPLGDAGRAAREP